MPVRRGSDRDAARYDLARLRKDLKPFRLHWFPTVGSTNTHAQRMRREGRLVAPSIVLTGRQTAGRGRATNRWHSPPGVMTVTFVLPAHPTVPPQHIPLIAGLAVRDAVRSFGVDDVGIKWPNDLWIEDRKLAGLLCERIDGIDLIGVGINARVEVKSLPHAIAGKSTSLHTHAAQPIDLTTLLVALARHLKDNLSDARTSLAKLLPRLRSADVLAGRRVIVSGAGETIIGLAQGIDSDGRLIVQAGSKRHLLFAGNIRLDDPGNR